MVHLDDALKGFHLVELWRSCLDLISDVFSLRAVRDRKVGDDIQRLRPTLARRLVEVYLDRRFEFDCVGEEFCHNYLIKIKNDFTKSRRSKQPISPFRPSLSFPSPHEPNA